MSENNKASVEVLAGKLYETYRASVGGSGAGLVVGVVPGRGVDATAVDGLGNVTAGPLSPNPTGRVGGKVVAGPPDFGVSGGRREAFIAYPNHPAYANVSWIDLRADESQNAYSDLWVSIAQTALDYKDDPDADAAEEAEIAKAAAARKSAKPADSVAK